MTTPTPVSIPVPRVGLAEVQPVPAPTLVPRVGTAGVRPVPAPIPVPWREATKLQPQSQPESAVSPAQSQCEHSVSTGGSGEPTQLYYLSTGGSGKPIQQFLMSAGGSGSPYSSSLYQLGFQESLTSHHLFLLGALVNPLTHQQLPCHCQLQLHHLHLLSDKTYWDVWKLVKTIEVSSCAYDNGRC